MSVVMNVWQCLKDTAVAWNLWTLEKMTSVSSVLMMQWLTLAISWKFKTGWVFDLKAGFHSWRRRHRVIWSSENQTNGVRSRILIPLLSLSLIIYWKLHSFGGVQHKSRRINRSQCLIPGLVIGWFFCFCFHFWQSSFHWIISDRVINRITRIGNILIL